MDFPDDLDEEFNFSDDDVEEMFAPMAQLKGLSLLIKEPRLCRKSSRKLTRISEVTNESCSRPTAYLSCGESTTDTDADTSSLSIKRQQKRRRSSRNSLSPDDGVIDKNSSSSGTTPSSWPSLQSVFSIRNSMGTPKPGKNTVKAFVEAAVRGCAIEALRTDGHVHVVTFRLNKAVDTIELIAETRTESSIKLPLNYLAATHLGSDAWAQQELENFKHDLDSSCVVLELCDDRCLALRFSGGNWATGEEEAKTCAACIQCFASEVKK
jgi:hypothetical protein